MRVRKLIQRLRGVPAFPVIPLVPIALFVTDAVLAVLNFQRLKRLEARVSRPVPSVARPGRVAGARA